MNNDLMNNDSKKQIKNLVIHEKNQENLSTTKNEFPETYYKNKTQRDLINKIFSNIAFDKDNKVKSLLKKKLSSYKQQDKNKKILRKEFPVITFDETTELLVASKLKCYYCKCKVLILYKQVREKKQWSLDRIDNSVGHHKDNVVISCLECNLKRRTTEIDRFTFTKQLKIKKIQTSKDATPAPKDATPAPKDATPAPKDATPAQNDANPAQNDATPSSETVKIVKSKFL